jgi:hypothetical protein
MGDIRITEKAARNLQQDGKIWIGIDGTIGRGGIGDIVLDAGRISVEGDTGTETTEASISPSTANLTKMAL